MGSFHSLRPAHYEVQRRSTHSHAFHANNNAGKLNAASCRSGVLRRPRSRSCVAVRAAADGQDKELSALGTAAIALGIVSNPLAAWSEYTLATTGSGLPPGPGGALGAAEGLSYLVIFGITGWSLFTKVKTGSGLPAGPAGLLGAVEGFSFLTVVAALGVFGFKALNGGLPGIFG